MARELRDLAEEVGGEELAERVERLEDELNEVAPEIAAEYDESQELDQLLMDEGDFSESAVEDMTLQAKKEVAEATGLRDERANVEIPVAGRTNGEPEEVTINRAEPETYEKEVEVPVAGGDDDPDTMTVEYQAHGPSLEAVADWRREMDQRLIERDERAKERARERREEQANGQIPTGVVNGRGGRHQRRGRRYPRRGPAGLGGRRMSKAEAPDVQERSHQQSRPIVSHRLTVDANHGIEESLHGARRRSSKRTN